MSGIFYRKQHYYYDLHKYDSSYLYIDSMVMALEQDDAAKDHPYEYASVLNAKGDYYYNTNDLSKAFEFYYRSRMAAPDTCNYANQTYHLGMVTYKQEKYRDAITYFRQSMKEDRSCQTSEVTFYRGGRIAEQYSIVLHDAQGIRQCHA
jgi:tetratricopeptide (TPR) repeat protein